MRTTRRAVVNLDFLSNLNSKVHHFYLEYSMIEVSDKCVIKESNNSVEYLKMRRYLF